VGAVEEMKLYLDRRKLLVGAFIAMVAVSSVNLILEGRDYLLMYTSLDQLQFTLSSLVLQEGGSSGAVVMAQVRADNSVDYGGLKVTVFVLSTFFFSDNASLFQKRPLIMNLFKQVLDADKATIWNLAITLNPQNATSLISFYHAHGGNVTGDVALSAEVTTAFFDAVTGNFVPYNEQQNVTLTQTI
jgi:hypothetical protein